MFKKIVFPRLSVLLNIGTREHKELVMWRSVGHPSVSPRQKRNRLVGKHEEISSDLPLCATCDVELKKEVPGLR